MISKFRSICIISLLTLISCICNMKVSYAQLSPGYAAGDIYVDYIGSNGGTLDTDYRYRVTLVVYTLCLNGSSTFPKKTETINVFSPTCAHSYCVSRNLPQVGKTDTVSQVCQA